jgi:hypothetical protein
MSVCGLLFQWDSTVKIQINALKTMLINAYFILEIWLQSVLEMKIWIYWSWAGGLVSVMGIASCRVLQDYTYCYFQEVVRLPCWSVFLDHLDSGSGIVSKQFKVIQDKHKKNLNVRFNIVKFTEKKESKTKTLKILW